MKLSFINRERSGAVRGDAAFTMVEIALCLAIVGFALVAIIGVLPAGLNVQKENREETIVNQDSTVWLDAIRSGALGYNELTQYVDRIVVTNWTYEFNATTTNRLDALTRTIVGEHGTAPNVLPPGVDTLLTSGDRVIGLLSTPRLVPLDANHFASNYVIAYCRAISGTASEKPSQANADVRELAFAYRMVVDVTPVGSIDPEGIATGPVDRIRRDNLAEVRLLLRWPLKEAFRPGVGTVAFPTDRPSAGNSKLVFRTQIAGSISAYALDPAAPGIPFYLINSREFK